jgi:hypothetical protein
MLDRRELDETARQCAMDCIEASDPRQCVAARVRNLGLTGWARPDAEAMADEAMRIIAFVRAGGKRQTEEAP